MPRTRHSAWGVGGHGSFIMLEHSQSQTNYCSRLHRNLATCISARFFFLGGGFRNLVGWVFFTKATRELSRICCIPPFVTQTSASSLPCSPDFAEIRVSKSPGDSWAKRSSSLQGSTRLLLELLRLVALAGGPQLGHHQIDLDREKGLKRGVKNRGHFPEMQGQMVRTKTGDVFWWFHFDSTLTGRVPLLDCSRVNFNPGLI